MLAFMKGIKDIELQGLTEPQDIKRAREIFKEILSMIKYMGKFFAVLLLYIYTGITDAKFKSDYHTLSLIMKTMMVSTYIFERYSFFLAQVLTIDDQIKYFNWRREVLKHKIACQDLIYLKKFIAVEEKRNLIRKNTLRRMSNAKMIPKVEMDYHVNRFKMDINEFLSHLQLQVNLELDEVFSSDLQAIIEYFKTLDEFINRTFPNAELEIKIDLMRLILRVTSSTKFVNYIYVLSNMNVDFLNECQIFALFCQVLLTELKKPKQDELLKMKELEESKFVQSVSPIKRKASNVADDSGSLNKTFDFANTTVDRTAKVSPLRLSCEPEPTPSKADSNRPSNLDDSINRTGVFTGKLVPAMSSFSSKARNRKDSVRSSESSEDLDQEISSPELSATNPKRLEKQSAFSKYKNRNSVDNQQRVLKRLGHIENMSSISQEFSNKTKSPRSSQEVILEPELEVTPFKPLEEELDNSKEDEIDPEEEVPRIDFLKKIQKQGTC